MEVCRGAKLFNANRLVHRDLKPQNLMRVEREGKVELRFIDFSTAVLVDKAKNKENDGVTGSDGYMSPEAYKINGFPDIKDDSWAVGAILCSMAFGKTPNQIFEEHVDADTGSFEKDTVGFAELSPDKKEEILLKELKIPVTAWIREYIGCIIDLTDKDSGRRATTSEAYRRLSATPEVDDGFDEPVSLDSLAEQETLTSGLNRAISRDSGIDPSEQAVEDLLFDNLPTDDFELGVSPEEGSNKSEESSDKKTLLTPTADVESENNTKQTEKKVKSPLEMTFQERQDLIADKRKAREAQYTVRADADKEWVEGFRGKTKKKNKIGGVDPRTKNRKK